MQKVFAYSRVSTIRQGEGVSLQEQKESIERYAEKHDLQIIRWLTEQETAAKRGRPLFTEMLKLLKGNINLGVVMHKIDRSARNLKDWADLGELIDKGVSVHFAHESIDLHARGGRLSADIQAVIAADYVRNLKTEVIKGMYGRLKQGLYPWQAPFGYLNTGQGKAKKIDPVSGEKVKELFTLYGTGEYSLKALQTETRRIAMRTKSGSILSVNAISRILNNPFYIGIMEIKGKTYPGIHKALISPKLFNKVQLVLRGKDNNKTRKHGYLFRKLLKCRDCHYSMIGERQKGNVYYRCHTKDCHTKTLREDRIDSYLLDCLKLLELNENDIKEITRLQQTRNSTNIEARQESQKILKLQLNNSKHKLDKLTNAYLENIIDKVVYVSKRKELHIQIKENEEKITEISTLTTGLFTKTQKILELAQDLVLQYKNANGEEKRQLLKILTSNLSVGGKNLYVSIQNPFDVLMNMGGLLLGGHDKGNTRIQKDRKDTSTTFVFPYSTTNHKIVSRKERINRILEGIERN